MTPTDNRRQRRRSSDLLAAALLVGLVVVGTFAIVALLASRDAREANERLDLAIRGSCERLQRERERSNTAEATIYLVLKTAENTTQSPRARKAYGRFTEVAAYSPPADCDRSVLFPALYRQPPTVPFDEIGGTKYALAIVIAAQAGRPQPLPRR
jgi:hypothetical protein